MNRLYNSPNRAVFRNRPPFEVAYNSLPDNLKQVIAYISKKTGNASPHLVFASMLGFMSTSCQAGYDVGLPYGGKAPLSLFLLSIAPSGARKSTVQNYFIRLIQQHEKSTVERSNNRQFKQKALKDIWLKEYKNKVKILDLAIKNDDEPQIQALTVELAQLYEKEPIKDKQYQSLYADTTRVGLIKGMACKNNNAAIATSEASMFIGELPKLCTDMNSIWSGEVVNINRANPDDCISLNDARLTISVMIQDGSLQDKVFKSEQVKDSGFFARLLINHVSSQTSGSLSTEFLLQGDEEAWIEFARCGLDLFEKTEEHYLTEGERITLSLSTESSQTIKQYIENIKNKFKNGYLNEIDLEPFIYKLDNHVTRIAALLMLFSRENNSSLIDLKDTQAAINIMDYYIEEQIYFFGSDGNNQNIIKLKNWFEKQRAKGIVFFERSYLLQNVTPHRLRKANILDKIITPLINEKFLIEQYYYGKKVYQLASIQHNPSYQTPINPAMPGRWANR